MYAQLSYNHSKSPNTDFFKFRLGPYFRYFSKYEAYIKITWHFSFLGLVINWSNNR